MMPRSELLIVFLCGLTLAACLNCYTCVFPAISPLDCLKFPQECAAGQRCLSSTATGRHGPIKMTMYEKGCAIPSQCGVTGQKYGAGLYFNFTTVCCDTELCNGDISGTVVRWESLALCLLPALILQLA
ncbi:hypothetical protein EXN66_Car000455 [Channa argus]|uniref:UPAR/Ly6 domain-containing protein n=1 Tax=Channa argus TaxID=215402 RepID=A0A6G1QXC8_CHAAH|nr:hypothetical protein EXN66_Car000455 [Channa argus]KAK2920931.1 hypothetical protein Q8A73_000416 [Channa argus]